MQRKRILALLLVLTMLCSLVPMAAVADDEEYEFWDLRNEDNISTQVLNGTVDGEAITVTRYYGYYAESSNSSAQQINIYVPSNATENSGILHLVNNSGWQSNNYPTNTISNNFNYSSDAASGNPSLTSLCVARGMIIISYGARSRGNSSGGEYIGHSPATMTDTKAALRFLRYNCQEGMLLEGLCNPDLAFVTGTSGGGGLSVVLAASGNSPDYYESLYEIGAAGVEKVGNSYVSTLSDAYIGTIAYCPIADLPMADQAYEFTYNASRSLRASSATVNGNKAAYESNTVMQASAWLAGDFTEYIALLNLYDESGKLLTASFDGSDLGGSTISGVTGGTFKTAMQGLLEKGINKAIDEHNSGYNVRSNADSVSSLNTYSSFIDVDGAPATAGLPAEDSVATISNLDQFLTTIPSSNLKIAAAFNGYGTAVNASQYENNLWGALNESWNMAHEWGWDNANTSGNNIATVGLGNTGKTWDEFLQSATGQTVALQMKMSSPIPYLTSADRTPYLTYAASSDECDPAPYWYVRHGQADRDTSFAVGTILYYALLNNEAVEDIDFNFAWRKAHAGNYDTLEAIDWLDKVMALEAAGGDDTDGIVITSADAKRVTNDSWANFDTAFAEGVNANVAVINYSYNTNLFNFGAFHAAEGVSVLTTEATETGARIILSVSDYNMQSLGRLAIQGKGNDDARFSNGWQTVTANVEYVLKDESGVKTVATADGSFRFTTVGEGEDPDQPVILGDTNGDGTVDIIDLSNIIDWFGYDGTEPDWDDFYTFFDFDSNGEIDIYDIINVAKLI